MSGYSEAFVRVVQLADALRVCRIDKRPGCWEQQVDERWWVAVNGHPHEIKCSHGAAVPPLSVYVEFNGWPAGYFGPGGGVIAAGDAANESNFIEALEDARARAIEKGGAHV